MVLKAKLLHSFWEKSVGLIGAKKISPVYFTTRWGIHTFGMPSPIDVVILDDTNQVVAIKKLSPNKIFFWNLKYSRVLELPAGEIEKKGIRLGDHITISENVPVFHRAHDR